MLVTTAAALLSQGIGHGIDQEGLRHVGEFLARRAATVR